jgi:hypothetical protein
MKKVISLNLKVNKMKVSEALQQAKEVISNPKNWLKGALSTTVCDYNTLQPLYRQYCSIGAMDHVAYGTTSFTQLERTFKAANNLASIARWNDNLKTKHSDVMQAFDKAIAYAQVREEPAIIELVPIKEPEPIFS